MARLLLDILIVVRVGSESTRLESIVRVSRTEAESREADVSWRDELGYKSVSRCADAETSDCA